MSDVVPGDCTGPWLTLCGHENKSCPHQIEFLSVMASFVHYLPPKELLDGQVVIFVCAGGANVDSNQILVLFTELSSASF